MIMALFSSFLYVQSKKKQKNILQKKKERRREREEVEKVGGRKQKKRSTTKKWRASITFSLLFFSLSLGRENFSFFRSHSLPLPQSWRPHQPSQQQQQLPPLPPPPRSTSTATTRRSRRPSRTCSCCSCRQHRGHGVAGGVCRLLEERQAGGPHGEHDAQGEMMMTDEREKQKRSDPFDCRSPRGGSAN